MGVKDDFLFNQSAASQFGSVSELMHTEVGSIQLFYDVARASVPESFVLMQWLVSHVLGEVLVSCHPHR